MPKYEFYVLHYDLNKHKVEMWNIFNNRIVYNKACELAEKYACNELTYEQLRDKLDIAIMCEEWSRYQYEISVGKVFVTDPEKELTKIDAYTQAHANIDLITKMVIDKLFEDMYHLERY